MMRLSLVTGGVRSGKSRWAQRTAEEIGGEAVTVIATAEPMDDEMRDRIEAHRESRPDGWETIEAPHSVGRAILRAKHETVVLDCLTVLSGVAMSRAKGDGREAALAEIRREVDGILKARTSRSGTLIVVTNEVGSSVHPATALGRWFQDGLGEANQRLALEADEVVLMVSGLEMVVKS